MMIAVSGSEGVPFGHPLQRTGNLKLSQSVLGGAPSKGALPEERHREAADDHHGDVDEGREKDYEDDGELR